MMHEEVSRNADGGRGGRVRETQVPYLQKRAQSLVGGTVPPSCRRVTSPTTARYRFCGHLARGVVGGLLTARTAT